MAIKKITEQDKRDIEQVSDILFDLSGYLCEIWKNEIRFDDCGEPIYEGLDEDDREIAEERYRQIESIDVANVWLKRIIREEV